MFTNVLEYLERSAALYPDKEALGDEQSSVTYAQYVNKAKVIGTAIIDITKEAYNKPIAVLIDRNIESVVSFMGIVYSGNFYVPIDITMPKERVDLIIETLKPSLIIDARREQDSEYLHFSEIFEQYEADETLIQKMLLYLHPNLLFPLFLLGLDSYKTFHTLM